MRVISIRTWRTKAGSETTVPSDRTTITSSTLRWLGRRESIRCFATYESGLLVSVSSDVRPETEQGPEQAEREEDEHAPDGEHPSWPPRGKRRKARRTETETSHLSSFDLTRRCAPGLRESLSTFGTKSAASVDLISGPIALISPVTSFSEISFTDAISEAPCFAMRHRPPWPWPSRSGWTQCLAPPRRAKR